MSEKNHLKLLIAQDRLKEAVAALLEKAAASGDAQLHNDSILLSARLEKTERAKILDTAEPAEYEIALNKIRGALLALTDLLPEHDPSIPATYTAAAPAVKPLPVFPHIDFSTLDWSHALRPEQTERVARFLLAQRRSVNLIGRKYNGMRRLLEDLENARIPGLLFIRVNLHNYLNNYAGFLDEIARQAGVKTEGRDLVDLMEYSCRETGLPAVLMIQYLDEILEDQKNADPRYDPDFLNKLNALRNTTWSRIVCLTAKSHENYQYHGNGSWLDLERLSLIDLTYKHIADELRRTYYAGILSDTALDTACDLIDANNRPVSLLKWLSDNMNAKSELTRRDVVEMVKQFNRKLI